jgi:superfamily II DNA or RNA helicase
VASNLRLPGKLWAHQRDALRTINDYLQAGGDEGRSALITMPTGTGKTGVIACAVTFPPVLKGHRLILTPWDALVRQLIADVEHRFWSQLAIPPPKTLAVVKRLPPSGRIEQLAHASEPTVYVATIAAIQVLAERRQDLPALFTDFDLVLVDEGHYEPAHQWSQAIRRLARPTVLLSATPYRNDEKFFRVGQSRFRFAHHRAVAKGFLRTPGFQRITRSSPAAFAAELVRTVSEAFPGESPRVIVRCADAESITRVVRALGELGQSAIGIHHTFQAGEGMLRRAVPAPERTDARFWVHQNKLIEGIDDPRFKVLAFFDALRNDRAVVQQIGRVLRNPGRAKGVRALVIGTGERDPQRTWEAYLQFDGQKETQAIATVPQLTRRILEAQPQAFYYDRAYRTRIDLSDPDAWRSFAFPLRTRVFRALARRAVPSLQALASAIEDEWREKDRLVFARQTPATDTLVMPYVTAENSPLLRSATFIEASFGFTVISYRRDLLFLYDARGSVPELVHTRLLALPPGELTVLFPDGKARLTSVALANTDIGRHAARTRQTRAAAIDELGPDLSDYAYVCTIAEGHTEIAGRAFRRYLGLSRARVVDHRPGERDFANYSAWLDELAAALRARGGRPVATFTRYAREVLPPDDPEPVHLLLDVDPSGFEQDTQAGQVPLELEDTAYAVSAGLFQIRANGVPYDATVKWDPAMARYDLSAPLLSAQAFHERTGDQRELLAEINRAQALRVVPAPRRQIYSHGSFYEPVIPVRRKGGFRLLDVLVPVPALDSVTSEKGTATAGDDWDPASVFGLISALDPGSARPAAAAISRFLPSPDLLLCTDMGTEIADFMATAPGRVVFMHAKASGPRRQVSASALHDVASQAIKNLPYLQPLSEEQPKSKNWASRWKAKGVTGTVRRKRVGTPAGTPALWAHLRGVISDPQAEREVWLLLGRSLSLAALSREAGRPHPAAEALQVFSLLQTTWGAVSQLGARLRIFCSP